MKLGNIGKSGLSVYNKVRNRLYTALGTQPRLSGIEPKNEGGLILVAILRADGLHQMRILMRSRGRIPQVIIDNPETWNLKQTQNL